MWRTTLRGFVVLAVTAATLVGAGAASAARARRAPAYSFLEYRAGTVEALALQAERNPRVRSRYARHFRIPGHRVARFIRQNLVVSYLPASGYRIVYFVRPGGRIVRRRLFLPRGTRVLALRNGEPVLRWMCGNAMVPALPRVVARPVPPAPPVVAPAEQVAVAPRVVSVPFEQVRVREVPPPVVPPPPVAAVPVPTVVPAVPVPVPAVAVSRLPALLPVAAVGPVPVVVGERPPRPEVGELPPPEIPIPEPNALAAMALGVAPLAAGFIRGRRRHRGA